jgi:hypothetical protein
VLAKRKKPFSDGEVVKEAMISAVITLIIFLILKILLLK